MKWYRAADGSLRLWFDPGEIDSIAEDELHRAGLMPPLEAPVVNLELFVEGHLGAELDQYAPLPPEVLGVTEFRSGLPPLIQINRILTDAALDDPHPRPGVRGRWRATLAHEAGHVLLHRVLAEGRWVQTSLIDTASDEGVWESPARLFRCLKREVVFGGGTDWREFQANRCMAALLMPRGLFLQAVLRAKRQAGLQVDEAVAAGDLEALAARLARWFQVSRQAARIRLQELGLVSLPGQVRLHTEERF